MGTRQSEHTPPLASRVRGLAPEVSIVVPAYNEEARLPDTLARIHSYLGRVHWSAEVLVVDDGSSDGTAACVQGLSRCYPRLRLLRNGHNRGKGYSVKHGVLQSRGQFVLFTDADLSTPIEQASRFLLLLDQGWDVVVGSRDLDPRLLERPQPWVRRKSGQVFHWLVWLLMGLPVRDTQCGFKAFRRIAAQSLFPLQRLERFGFDVEILWLAHRLGFRCLEVAVPWRNDERTHVSLTRDGPAMLLELAHLRWLAWRNGHKLGVEEYPALPALSRMGMPNASGRVR